MEVLFYQTLAGVRPVEKYLASLPMGERAKVLAAIEDLRKFGLKGSGVLLKHIGDKLWEIKVGAQRVFYVVLSGPRLILLHAYKKESQKAPKNELRTAQRRMREVLGGDK